MHARCKPRSPSSSVASPRSKIRFARNCSAWRGLRAARSKPGRGAEGHRRTRTAARALAARGGEWQRPPRCEPRDRQRAARRTVDHTGRRVAGRQLLRCRRAAARDSRRPAGRVLSRAACAGQRPARRVPAGIRYRMGVRRAHRQPLRSGFAEAFRARLSEGTAAHDRRTLGADNLAAGRARGESPARRRRDRSWPRRPTGSRCTRRRIPRTRRRCSPEPCHRDGAQRQSAARHGVRGGTPCSAASRSRSGRGPPRSPG